MMKPMTTLIVDDLIDMRQHIREIIADVSNIIEAVDGLAAYELLTASSSPRIDFITLDLMMPRMTGLELLQQLNSQENVPPILVISSDNTLRTRQKCLALGALDVLGKPAPADAVLHYLNHCRGD